MDFFGKASSRPPQRNASQPASNTQPLTPKTTTLKSRVENTSHNIGQNKSRIESVSKIDSASQTQTERASLPTPQPQVQEDTSKLSLRAVSHDSPGRSSSIVPTQEDRPSLVEQIPSSSVDVVPSKSRIIKSSDDEDDDSDSSLEDLNVLLAMRKPNTSNVTGTRPKTPPKQVLRNANFHKSPLTVLSKSKFDMNALLSHARKDEAMEASSKRMKAMIGAEKERRSEEGVQAKSTGVEKLAKSTLLKSVVSEQGEGGMAKVTRALLRTEATVAEKRFHFFDEKSSATEPRIPSFPKGASMRGWEQELGHSRTRAQNFTSGFVEDMVQLGKQLPDEIFSWILEATVLTDHNTLTTSYLNVLRYCPDQINTAFSPAEIRRLFLLVGAKDTACTLSTKTQRASSLLDHSTSRDWGKRASLIRMLGKVGSSLSRESRVYSLCMLLRIATDQAVIDNVEILTEQQKSVTTLLKHYPDEEWDQDCATIIQSLFAVVEQPSFRFNLVDAIVSTSTRAHDLKRRMAMCFFFNDAEYSTTNPYHKIDLERVMLRLGDRDFDARPSADYPELRALVRLLDVAVDDGRSYQLDYKDSEVEKAFNKDVDDLVLTIKDIMTSIGNPGAAFVSRIEAKETLELVSQRIADTVRTKRKPKESWFNKGVMRDEWASEKQGLNRFVVKTERIKKEQDF